MLASTSLNQYWGTVFTIQITFAICNKVCALCAGNQCYLSQAVLTPVSKRRKSYSVCLDNYSEADRLRDELNDAPQKAEMYRYKKMVGVIFLKV